jgi:hypothetical protein
MNVEVRWVKAEEGNVQEEACRSMIIRVPTYGFLATHVGGKPWLIQKLDFHVAGFLCTIYWAMMDSNALRISDKWLESGVIYLKVPTLTSLLDFLNAAWCEHFGKTEFTLASSLQPISGESGRKGTWKKWIQRRKRTQKQRKRERRKENRRKK